MTVTLKKWGNSSGVRFSKEFLKEAGVRQDDSLKAEIINGQIVLTPIFRHRSLKERAQDYGGELRLSTEIPRGDAVGSEVW